MNRLAFILLFCMLGSLLMAQSKQVSKAISDGPNSDMVYSFKSGKKDNLLTPEKLVKWFESNNDKYLLIDYTSQKEWAYGSEFVLISGFSFLKTSELSQYNEAQRQKAVERARKAESDAIITGVALGVLANYLSGVAQAIKESPKSNYSTSTSSYSASSEKSSSSSSLNTSVDYQTIPLPEYEMGEWDERENYVTGSKWRACRVKFDDGKVTVWGNIYYDKAGKYYYLEDWAGGLLGKYETEDQVIRALYIRLKYKETIEY